jgi:hypothetical protein
MKVRSIIISAVLLTASALFISVAPASAGDCSAENPCHTYAMVDASGNVTNTIVCQPSVCGSGTFAGMKVVPQVVANPETHKSQGGYLANPGDAPVTESNGRFTITTDSPVVSRTVVEEGNTSTVLQTTIASVTQKSFTFEDTIGAPNGIPALRDEPMRMNTKATLSATQFSGSDTSTAISKELAEFENRQPEDFVNWTLELERLEKIFRNWNWFKMSLVGWFI